MFCMTSVLEKQFWVKFSNIKSKKQYFTLDLIYKTGWNIRIVFFSEFLIKRYIGKN